MRYNLICFQIENMVKVTLVVHIFGLDLLLDWFGIAIAIVKRV